MLLLDISYVALWSLTIFCCVLLHEAFREIVEHWEVVRRRGATRLAVGMPIPSVRVVELATGKPLELSSLSETVLFFVSAPQRSAPSFSLGNSIQYLKSKGGGGVAVICRGAADDCRNLIPAPGNGEIAGDKPRVLLDSGGFAMKWFGIQRTPIAVTIDRAGRIAQYGFQRAGAGHTPDT